MEEIKSRKFYVSLFASVFLCVGLTFFSCSGAMGGGGTGLDTTGRFSFDFPASITLSTSEQAVPVSMYKVEMVSATGFEEEALCEPSDELVLISGIESGHWLVNVSAMDGAGAVLRKIHRNVDLAVGEEKYVPLGLKPPVVETAEIKE